MENASKHARIFENKFFRMHGQRILRGIRISIHKKQLNFWWIGFKKHPAKVGCENKNGDNTLPQSKIRRLTPKEGLQIVLEAVS